MGLPRAVILEKMDSIEERRERAAAGTPGFELIREGDTPFFEALGEDHGGYLPETESLSILDSKPLPEKRDYLPVLATIASILLLAIAVRVLIYYAGNHNVLDTSSLEARAHVVPLTPLPETPQTSPVDDTLYFPQPGVTLPLLQSKFEPSVKGDGKVILLALIDQTGKPVDSRIMRGLDPDLNVAALQAAGKWRFRPGTKDGKPVPVIAQFAVNFHQQ